MTLIKSVSGIRGTIGGHQSENLTPPDVVRFVSAFGTWMKNTIEKESWCVVVGRDARVSGRMVKNLVTGTLMGLGIDVLDLDLATTPTVELTVQEEEADGGIIITASHNPFEWNALKLLNSVGEFISAETGAEIIRLADGGSVQFAGARDLGTQRTLSTAGEMHIGKILDLPLVDVNAIQNARFKIAIDCVHSVGGLIIPDLLKALGVQDVVELYCEPTGDFPHDPEPLPKNLTALSETVVNAGAGLGMAVDPDVDRLAIVCEDGSFFGEENTLVAVADYILKNQPGNTVSNLSSSRALRDISDTYGVRHTASAVGEVHVVEAMKNNQAVIGGEGNGGVIFPELHYGRDALVGIALFLSYLAAENKAVSDIRKALPAYFILKEKIAVDPGFNFSAFLSSLKNHYKTMNVVDIDGLRVDFENEWFHIRKSNTEPVIRVIAESSTAKGSEILVKEILGKIKLF